MSSIEENLAKIDHLKSYLEETREDLKEVRSDVKVIMVDLAALKVRAGIWGLVGGAIPIALVVVIEVLKGPSTPF